MHVLYAVGFSPVQLLLNSVRDHLTKGSVITCNYNGYLSRTRENERSLMKGCIVYFILGFQKKVGMGPLYCSMKVFF